jgi:hypothetical protein
MLILRCSFVIFSLTILFSGAALAGGPVLKEDCKDQENRTVSTRYDVSINVFAEAKFLPRNELDRAKRTGLSPYVIHVNPDRYYISRLTQQWLYDRQCAHIRAEHLIVQEGLRALTIRDEERADCLALDDMSGSAEANTPSISMRDRYSIERDIERVMREGRWQEVLPGPQRRISLSTCK